MPAYKIEFGGAELALEDVPCDFCGGTSSTPFWQISRHQVPLQSVLCNECCLCRTNPRLTRDSNELFYLRLYHLFHKRTGNVKEDSEYLEKAVRMAPRRVAYLKRFLDPSRPLRVLEVGVGAGQFLVAGRAETAWDLSGIDAGDEQVSLAREHGFDVRKGFIESADLSAASYSAIVLFHVFEHLLSPAAFIQRANQLLSPDGLIYLEVPNLLSPGGSYSDFFQLPHQYTFTTASLRNYLTALGGFQVIFSTQRSGTISMIGKKVRNFEDLLTKPCDFERGDVNDILQQIRTRERFSKLARVIPNLPVLSKVRATLLQG